MEKVYQPTTSIGARIQRVQDLKVQIDALERELDQERAYLLGHMLRQDLKSVQCGPTTVTRRERANWIYSETVKRSEKTLKARKQREQEDGTAINNPTEHVIVTISAKAILANAIHA